MRKRLIWIIVGCLVLGGISYGAFGLSERPVSAEISKETKGQFVRVEDGGKRLVVSTGGQEAAYPVSAAVWVYRNMQKSALADLQPGDTVDIILNSKDQAAYIKAASAQESAQASAGQESNDSASQGSPTSPATGGSAEASAGTGAKTPTAPAEAGSGAAAPQGTPAAPTASSAATASGSKSTPGSNASTGKDTASVGTPGTSGSSSAKAWEKLSFEWKSREFELKVKQEPAKPGSSGPSKSEMFLQTNDRSIIHLEGAEADSFIQLLMKGVPSDAKSFETSLKQKIASEFQLKNTSPEWKLDVKWLDKAANSSPQESKAKGNEKEKPKDNGKGKDKEKEKEKEKHQDKGRNGHDDD
ncbi:hypothetical protein [Paenibacillus sp. 32352]|uniref:hypothetical protein n=1 Tax=Paenibacillus sp. 32352 TaxID=1969111 RepID=UPI0009AC8198|nr:hypothetical protein [Paenibacillus sp. 32352]